MIDFPPGLYDLLQTPQLRKRLECAGLLDRAVWSNVDPAELPTRLATHLAREFAAFLGEIFVPCNEETWHKALHDALSSPEVMAKLLPGIFPDNRQSLFKILSPGLQAANSVRPDTPLSVSALLTGSSRSPALRTQLQKELVTCDSADWLVSFIKYAGIVPLLDALRTFTQTPTSDGRPRLRIATTSYMGATDVKAIEALLKLPNTEIRVSYDTRRTRLHAKAYLFHRSSGFSSAYIGSANISKAALDEGLEWTAKISQYEAEHLWNHAVATFESHWEDPAEFSPCNTSDLPVLRQALANEQSSKDLTDTTSFFDVRPYEYQRSILEDIAAERAAGKNKHLIIAATGTGKRSLQTPDFRSWHHSILYSETPLVGYVHSSKPPAKEVMDRSDASPAETAHMHTRPAIRELLMTPLSD
jgi:HKD family nuclease